MTWELAEDLAHCLGPVALFTGHPDTLKKSGHENIRLYEAPAYHRGGTIRRFWCWSAYCFHLMLWIWRWPSTTPILIFSNPPILVWFLALVHRLRGTRFCVMVHDIYPDVFIRKGLVSTRHPLVRLWRRLNRWAYGQSELVMTLGRHMAAALAGQINVENAHNGEIEVIGPWGDGEVLRRVPKEENWFAEKHGQCDKLTLMYSGNMGLGHDLETMLAAAERFKDDSRLHFMFIGAGPKWQLAKKVTEDGQLSNVTVLPWQAESVLPFSLSTADIGLVSLEVELSGLAVPSKAFYFLAAETPLIALCKKQTELADVIEHFECGAVIEPGDVDGMCCVLTDVLDNPGRLSQWRRGTKRAMMTHSRAQSTLRIADLLRQKLIADG